ncbi:hypothetical protein I4U23_006621 [Adineta vaga]|nr:hypothetical protein I4U23_006621 [Adineta vaga]
MTIILSSKPIPANATLNIRLKTHSLNCLNIPLDTSVGIQELTSLYHNDHHKIIAGSVDLISEISNQSNDKTLTRFAISKPLINLVPSNEQQPIIQPEWRQVLKERFHISNSFITANSLDDSLTRLRRHRQLTNLHQSSLQTIDKIIERKRRFSLSYHGPLPKFACRYLSSKERPSTSLKPRMSPYTSLPEIHSFREQNGVNDSFQSTASSWEKSDSWSWKSNDVHQSKRVPNERKRSNISKQRPIDDCFHSKLPIIIESPLQPIFFTNTSSTLS